MQKINLFIGLGVVETYGEKIVKLADLIKTKFRDENGFNLPIIRIRDDLSLNENEVELFINGKSVGKMELFFDKFFVFPKDDLDLMLDFESDQDYIEPIHGIRCKLVDKEKEELIKENDYFYFDAQTEFLQYLSYNLNDKRKELLTFGESQRVLRVIYRFDFDLAHMLFKLYTPIQLWSKLREYDNVKNIIPIVEQLILDKALIK